MNTLISVLYLVHFYPMNTVRSLADGMALILVVQFITRAKAQELPLLSGMNASLYRPC